MLGWIAPLALPFDTGRPLIIAHRGASGERPEHTLEAYDLAIRQGADFIEPDLVITKDGTLIARHENELSDTTDVAARPEFAARRTSKRIDGRMMSGWFAEDFTLAEIRTLRAKERLPQLRAASAGFDGQFPVPTFAEVIELAQRRGRELGRPIGVYPETKHPTYFRSIGLPLEEPLVADLRKADWNRADAPVFIQSFEVGNLKRLKGMTPVRLVQLLADGGAPFDFVQARDKRTYRDLARPAGLREIAAYAYGIGPNKNLVFPRNAGGEIDQPSSLVKDARAAGLKVHVWTFRNEATFLPRHQKPEDELRRFFEAGIDGVFTDFPRTAVNALSTR